jgi:YfiH family protein
MTHGMHADWLTPRWPAPPCVQALCTTRQGGVSLPPYDSFNLGRFVGDDPGAVRANWAALGAAMGARAVYLRQVHGTAVQPLDVHTPDGIEADACTTAQPGVACIVMAADCLPVLFTNASGTRVAAAHAGWRGLAAGVLEAALESFGPVTPAGQAQATIEKEANDAVIAWLGPCIGPTAFEVGPEVREAFCDQAAQAARHFAPGAAGKFMADLAALARQRLRARGVRGLYGNDSSAPWCTVGNPSRFFSHRRDTPALGTSGRMAAGIWIG